ncbi:hypothetical protein [Clostridium estertheticum]|uniref:hypothetical protein n=1 Tax=Clostridium estertheticum TaxID=238834 RepID=UPI001C7E171D|nr:hypothetical protein [Clostridium estertheticum]MBX4266531.1 hypothetical protein [Clostridium estertheticum]WLC88129.1 hypothetical protein KTC95_19240 [Clostridium estertheticum]
MRYRMLDENGDYSFGKGQQNFTFGRFAVSQAIDTSLALLKGEWWEDISAGLPLFQNILGKTGSPDNIAIADLFIKKRINEVTGVTSIEGFTSSYADRVYTFTCSVNTLYGVVKVTS